jgi:DNA-binding winged helix-turn-helix (wHTH) protein/HAMP domain-containing protein
MRWWLGLAFACVSALTAVAVVTMITASSNAAFRKYSEQFAIGNTSMVAQSLKRAPSPALLDADAAALASRHRLALFVLSPRGRLLTATTSNHSAWSMVPDRVRAVHGALDRGRYVQATPDGYVIARRLSAGEDAPILVTYSIRPELREQLGLAHNELIKAGLIAFIAGATLGMLIATLTARRLARIARAAVAIGRGEFDTDVKSRYPDEVGSLARSLERMKQQLQVLVHSLERDRERLERSFDCLDEAVLVVNGELEVEFANERAEQFLAAGKRLNGDPATAPLGSALRKIALQALSSERACSVRFPDGDRSLLLSAVALGENPESVVIVIMDQQFTLSAGGISIDLRRSEVRVDGTKVPVTPSEFKILSLLATAPGTPFTRHQILEQLWGTNHIGDQHACEVYVASLRRKIERDPGSPRRLLTVRGVGYSLVAG